MKKLNLAKFEEGGQSGRSLGNHFPKPENWVELEMKVTWTCLTDTAVCKDIIILCTVRTPSYVSISFKGSGNTTPETTAPPRNPTPGTITFR